MPQIKQLAPHEAQKIAAGEVVERPANIVKELVENSIDAGATRISIYVEDGGKKLIRIVDNGCGMDTADAQKCFDRHATSKITCVDELEKIDTFGFRGEALASIASVSKITLQTKQEDCLEGTQVVIEAHTIKNVSPVACSTGTDISVHDLFFNVPARQKFLKATSTEWRTIQLLFNAFCFDYPHIHFSLFSEGKQIHNCPTSTDLKMRALQLFEPSAHHHLLSINTHDKEIEITAITSDHQHYRYDRSSIYFFVNKRWVKNQHLSNAFIKGYANVIPQGRYPIAAINITVPAHEVDINIHPRKEEVKFLHPRRVEQILQQAVKAALENNLSKHLKKNVTFNAPEQQVYAQQIHDFNPFDFDPTSLKLRRASPFFDEKLKSIPFNTPTSEASRANRDTTAINLTEQKKDFNPFVTNTTEKEIPYIPFALSASEVGVSKGIDSESTEIIQETLSSPTPDIAPTSYRLIGQYNNTYLLIEKEDGLFLIDQHAAHERILYELFANRFSDVATIQLLFPHIITLSAQNMKTVAPHLDIFTQHGIIIEQCASNQLMVQSLPVHLKDQSISNLIEETISWICESASLDETSFKKTINHKLQAQMACKAAVKAGDTLTQEKMEQLLIDLEKTENRFSCPHGRPTSWLFSLIDIEKKFRRRL